MVIPIKLLHSDAKTPTRATSTDAGYDLYSLTDGLIAPRGRLLVSTGVSVAIPDGYFGHVLPRSGLAVRDGIHVGAGVIDAGFRSQIGVLLFNLSDVELSFKQHYRIAQLVIKKCYDAEWQPVDELPSSERADKGFGSSGN